MPAPELFPAAAVAAAATTATTSPITSNDDDQTSPPPAPAAPPAPTFQPPTLRTSAINALARDLDVLTKASARNRTIPVDAFLSILQASSTHRYWVEAAETVLQIEQNMPCLECEEVDEVYWKKVVELGVGPSTSTPITLPYPLLVARVLEIKTSLEEWMAAHIQAQADAQIKAEARVAEAKAKEKEERKKAKKEKKEAKKRKRAEKEAAAADAQKDDHDAGNKKTDKDKKMKKEKRPSIFTSSSSSSTTTTTNNRSTQTTSFTKKKASPTFQQQEQQKATLALLRELRRVPISMQLLQDAAGIGETISRVSKFEKKVGGGGGGGGGGGPLEEISRLASKVRKQWKEVVANKEGEAAEKEGEKEKVKNDPISPFKLGQRAVEMKTWKHVYEFSLEYAKHRRALIGKRAQELTEDHHSKRRRTEAIEEKLGDAAAIEAEARKGRPPVGNTDRIRKLIKMQPKMKPRVEKFGTIMFSAPTKKKNLIVQKKGGKGLKL